MSDYIKREDAIVTYANHEVDIRQGKFEDYRQYMRNVLRSVESADVAPVQHAHWIKEEYWSEGVGMGESHGHYYKCSACGKRVKLLDLYLDDYCRKCGAEMYEAKECEQKRQKVENMLAVKNKEWKETHSNV